MEQPKNNQIPSLETKKPKIYLSQVREIIKSDIFLKSAREQLDLISDKGDTLRHTQRVMNCGYLLMKHLAEGEKISQEQIELFVETCLVHDLGKIDVDYKNLTMPYGKFSATDFEIVKQHVIRGYEDLKMHGIADEVCVPVLIHHTFQKDPYPPEAVAFRNKKKKTEDEKRYERNGKLLAMIDAFESCAFGRKYIEMKPLSIERTREILMEKFRAPEDEALIDFLISKYGEIKDLGI